jgi:hypothetical protein
VGALIADRAPLDEQIRHVRDSLGDLLHNTLITASCNVRDG